MNLAGQVVEGLDVHGASRQLVSDVPDSWAEATRNDSDEGHVLLVLARDHTNHFRHRTVEVEDALDSSLLHHGSMTSPPSHDADIYVQESGVEAVDASHSHPKGDVREDNDEGCR